jgi:serine/threonine protein kinase
VANRFQVGDQIGPYRITATTVNGYHAVHAGESHAVLIEVWPDGGTDIGAKIAAAAHALASVNHHGIAQIVDYGMLPDGQPWMASDRVIGTVAHDMLVGRALRADKVAELIRSVAEVLRFAHAHDIIHGRLRAHSIVVTEHDSVSINGWGIHQSGAHRERSVYDAPEARASSKSDVYALGVSAYRALTGQFPRGSLTMHVPGAPPPLAQLIVEMTAPDPANRPSAADVRDAIADLLGEHAPVDVISLDEIDDFAPDSELLQPAEVIITPRFARPRWTPATHLAPIEGMVTPPISAEEDFEA